MKVSKDKNKIYITNEDDFNIVETLECGQIFSYIKTSPNTYIVISANKFATITFNDKTTEIESADIDYFHNFFDLDTDYKEIKKQIISQNPKFEKFLTSSRGIRILKQDIFQTIISFIVSANNNIKRIKGILFRMSSQFGTKIDGTDTHFFPNLEQLSKATKQDFEKLGAGYRSDYLVKTINMLKNDFNIQYLTSLETQELRKKLLTLSGIGPKVADCILLFGFKRGDVFPVDTWIRKSYYMFETKEQSDENISKYFVNIFKNFSGYAQQYLFNYMINISNKAVKNEN